MRSSIPFIAALVLSAGAAAAQDADQHTALTIYSTASPGAIPPELYRPVPGQNNPYYPQRYGQVPGYAVIKQDRRLTLDRGTQQVEFTDVAAYLDPTTVQFTSLTDPEGTVVVEQDYRFDLLSMDKMLQRYIGQQIFVGSAAVTLMSVSGGGMLYQDDSGRITFQQGYGGVAFPKLADGLILEPTLLWTLHAGRAGAHDTRITYQTSGVSWWADYNLVFADGRDENSGTLDVGAWVSILNQSGGTYENAKLKLVAGDVHRAQPKMVAERMMRSDEALGVQAIPAGFQEQSFFEYHLYTLGRPTTIPDNSTKQIELFEPARGVPVDKVLVYDGTAQFSNWGYGRALTDRNLGGQSDSKVEVYLRFDNAEDAGLGVPLPSGRIRVSKLDPADGSLEFIGEDIIDHTPREEEVLIKLGNAFDVVGERKQVDFRVDTSRRVMEETIEVTLRNRKESPVEVIAQEQLYRWVNWEIIKTDTAWKKEDSRRVRFTVKLEPDEERTIRYTVRYTW